MLKQDHLYYFQMQPQMKLCKAKFYDFVVWGKDGALKQQVDYNTECINDALKQVIDFVKMCLLPKLLSCCLPVER